MARRDNTIEILNLLRGAVGDYMGYRQGEKDRSDRKAQADRDYTLRTKIADDDQKVRASQEADRNAITANTLVANGWRPQQKQGPPQYEAEQQAHQNTAALAPLARDPQAAVTPPQTALERLQHAINVGGTDYARTAEPNATVQARIMAGERAKEKALDRDFRTSERVGGQDFRTSERVGGQGFTGAQGDLNRSTRLSAAEMMAKASAASNWKLANVETPEGNQVVKVPQSGAPTAVGKVITKGGGQGSATSADRKVAASLATQSLAALKDKDGNWRDLPGWADRVLTRSDLTNAFASDDGQVFMTNVRNLVRAHTVLVEGKRMTDADAIVNEMLKSFRFGAGNKADKDTQDRLDRMAADIETILGGKAVPPQRRATDAAARAAADMAAWVAAGKPAKWPPQ